MKEHNPPTIRLNKYLADKNYASRRGADTLIQQGRVFVNGERATLGQMVQPGDVVEVAGREAQENEYFAYYKPRGVVTIGAQGDEKEIKDITDFPPGIFPLGRLDKDSEGLIIMTNDGRITDPLLSPESEHEKEYTVTIGQPVTHQLLVQLSQGVKIGSVGKVRNYKTKQTEVRRRAKNSFDIILREGKNRQIRKMCGALGVKVTRLKRFRIINVKLRGLRANTYRKLKDKELKEFLGALGMQN